MNKQKTALILGVTGQDGSYLAEQLLAEGMRVVGMARRTSQPNLQNLTGVLSNPLFALVDGDITDATCLNRLVNSTKPDFLYNLAAQSYVATSFQEPSHTLDVVSRGALNVLEAVRASDRSQEIRVYQASSSEMFGSNYSIVDKEGKRFDFVWGPEDTYSPFINMYQSENTPLCPNSPYAVGKVSSHHLVRVYRESYGIFAVAGILMNHESNRRPEHFVTRKITRWVGRVVAAGKKGRLVPRLSLGNPNALRDWGYAPEYMRAATLMLRAPFPQDLVIATGQAYTVKEFLMEALACAGLPASTERDLVDWAAPQHLRPCEVGFLRGDPSRARSSLGWTATTTFPLLVSKMVNHDIDLALKEANALS